MFINLVFKGCLFFFSNCLKGTGMTIYTIYFLPVFTKLFFKENPHDTFSPYELKGIHHSKYVLTPLAGCHEVG